MFPGHAAPAPDQVQQILDTRNCVPPYQQQQQPLPHNGGMPQQQQQQQPLPYNGGMPQQQQTLPHNGGMPPQQYPLPQCGGMPPQPPAPMSQEQFRHRAMSPPPTPPSPYSQQPMPAPPVAFQAMPGFVGGHPVPPMGSPPTAEQISHILRRMTISHPNQIWEPHIRSHSGHGYGISPLDFDVDVDEYDAPIAGHRASAPLPYIPMVDLPPNVVHTPAAHRGMATAPPQPTQIPIALNQRPYGYFTGFQPGAPVYETIGNDVQLLLTAIPSQQVKDVNTKPMIGILVQRTPYELDALRYAFRETSGQDLGNVFYKMLVTSNVKDSIRFAFMGLVLGPCLFDLWLLQSDLGKNSDILIDIFVGRHPDDIRDLSLRYAKQTNGKSLASAVYSLSSSSELKLAMKICTEAGRPDPNRPVDTELVIRDVQEIKTRLGNAFGGYEAIANILLRRSDPHIFQIAMYYEMEEGEHLDKVIRENATLSKMARRILVHAVRTATHLTYRDVMLVRDALGQDSLLGAAKNEKLAMRVCRMHWYTQHWRQIKAEFMGLAGKELIDKLNAREGLLGDLLVAMAQV